ncbi:MAG: DUF4160 domain-containing protein [Magnetococcales bacterium]|nr:DUF4160 domain-containing protein [Magnetococcales bacterium]MBF0115181.1 DUF4160 domain-containing protein [Magnetococcales bacterium]
MILKGYFKDFLAFFLPQAHAEIDWSRPAEFLDQEFSRLMPSSENKDRRVDLLVKVWLLDGSERWVLIHVEVHGKQHHAPHLHAEYGEMNAVFQAWIELHRDELLADWKLAMEGHPC